MNQDNLKLESIYFAKFFFSKEIADAAIMQYISGNQKIFLQDNNYTIQSSYIEQIVSNKADIEAIEYAWRLRDRQNILTKKIRIVFYILEVKSDYLSLFVNTKKSFLSSAAIIFLSALKSVYKLYKGKFLLRKYGIV